jgi:hypothetical protein
MSLPLYILCSHAPEKCDFTFNISAFAGESHMNAFYCNINAMYHIPVIERFISSTKGAKYTFTSWSVLAPQYKATVGYGLIPNRKVTQNSV